MVFIGTNVQAHKHTRRATIVFGVQETEKKIQMKINREQEKKQYQYEL